MKRLAPVAARAARAFARRRQAHRHGTATRWHPVALRWRRTPERSRAASPVPANVTVFNSWLAQIHLRLSALFTTMQRRAPAAEPRTAAALPRGDVHWHTAVWHSPRAAQPLAPNVTRAEVRWRPGAFRRAALSERRLHRSWAPRERRLSSLAQREAAPMRQRTSSPRSQAEHSLLRSHTTLYWQSRTAHITRHHEQTAERPRVTEIRAPAVLVWRKPAAPDSAMAGRELHSATPYAPPAGQAPSHTPAAAAAASTAQTKAAAAAALLEPSIVERLTDDVMRRVERRVRIERERRGL